MSLGEHLLEFRRRLFIAAGAILLASVAGFLTAEWVWRQLRIPLVMVAEAQGRTADVSYTYVTEAFDTRMQIAIAVGLVLSSPVWLYQLWAFFMPALHRKEKRYALGFALAAVPLFVAGCYVGWLILPNMVTLLVGFAAEDAPTLLKAKDYLDFSTKLLLAIGVGFVFPVFLVLVNFVGVLTAKQIVKGWRVAVVVIATFAALATPAADILSMVMLIVPMTGLYLLAAGVAWLNDRRRSKRDAALLREAEAAT